MKKKIVIALIAVAIILAAIIAGVCVANKDVADTAVIGVITTDEQEQQDAGIDAVIAMEETEEAIEIVELSGVITEIADEYVLLDAGEMGMIQANTSMDTLIEGVEELMVGQTAVILYDGKMTRSLPAQITALKIGVYAVKGTVTEIVEGRVTITKTEGGEVVLTLPEGAPELAVGDAITAYTTGISTMSLPPQMNAIAVVK
ncbi:MAG: hypothetical protein E7321_05170 [Clostridiales bacterium]|nr:hypothetical protein [Clostridiales bacterium]